MALDIVDQLVRSSAIDLIVVDSVAALVPRAELEGDMLDAQMGLQARLMSKALRKITGSLSKSHTSVIFLNQLRSKIGVFYGNPEVTAGGNALKFYSSVRVDIRRKEVLKDNMGISVRVKVVKNKVGYSIYLGLSLWSPRLLLSSSHRSLLPLNKSNSISCSVVVLIKRVV
jgi:recombination protein RecA